MKRILAVCLALTLLLTGCTGGKLVSGYGKDYVAYENMEYTRPSMSLIEQVLTNSCNTVRSDTSLDTVLSAIYDYYDAYDRFYTNYNLAYIAYNRDVTDEYWQAEYEYCAGNSATVDAGLEKLYMALADSPIRSKLESDAYFGLGYFDAYEDEATWDEGFLALMEEEYALISAYYDLSAQADSAVYYSEEYFDGYADDLCQALIDLVKLRQQIAAYAGYDSYVQFAYDFYYYRDYTPRQAMDYMEDIRTEMSNLYQQVNQSDIWSGGYGYCSEDESFSYVQSTAAAMGGVVEEAFGLMERAGLYDISYSENKFNTCLEIYLTSYSEPYVFVSPSGYDIDKLSFAHEFGHFVTDYACGESYAGIDVLEVFSQGMEYLSLCYDNGEDWLERYKMADCLSTYVEQAAYACFEQKLYDLTSDELTVENVFALYDQVCRSYGIDFEALGWDPRDLVTVPHYYTDPLYIISYVVSNDAAFQLLQLELDENGAGLAKYEENLTTDCYYFLEFVEEAGLESPFALGRVQRVAQDLEQLLG